MNPERFSPSFELKTETTAERGVFEGWASTFGGPPDSHGDIIVPGAFGKSLASRVPAMLWVHDQAEPIGRWLKVREESQGLYVKGKFTLGTRRGSEAYALAQDDALGLSIGYTIPPGGKSYDGNHRVLTEIDLHEVSPVPLPSNTRARITAVKSALTDITSPREVERRLRDMGLSQLQAKRFMSRGYKALLMTDEEDRMEHLAARFAAFTHELAGK